MICNSCGTDNRTDASFCYECGSELEHRPEQGSKPADHPSGRETASGPQPLPEVGATVGDGRFTLELFLGEGGNKRVFLSTDNRLGRQVAVALLKTEGMSREDMTRIAQEARLMAELGDHPNIVKVFDYQEEDGQAFVVSEFMEGGDLDQVLAGQPGGLDLETLMNFSRQLASALEYAHERGVIHRDLKPSNVWLTGEGVAKLGDFGLAVQIGGTRVTKDGTMIGTAAYMAPECAVGGGRKAEIKSDLYSLGALMYELATGRPPFLGDIRAVVSQHISARPEAPSRHRSDLPKVVESLILRLLEKPLERRPESAREVRERIDAILSAIESRTDLATIATQEASEAPRISVGNVVGRVSELAELRAAIDEAVAGQGGVCLVTGEAGVGKSALVEEALGYAELRGALILSGSCFEGEGAPPYWPWVQALKSLLQAEDTEALEEDLRPVAPELVTVLPDVSTFVSDIPEAPKLDPEQARFRMFEAVSRFLTSSANRRPLVVVLEDLQWGDKASLLMLEFVAEALAKTPALVIATYRDAEIGKDHPLSGVSAHLARNAGTRRINLTGLARNDIEALVADVAGVDPPEALVDVIYRETEGNPFFAREIVLLLAAEDRLDESMDARVTLGSSSIASGVSSSGGKAVALTIPQTIRGTIEKRLQHLNEKTRALLARASVVGRAFSISVLENISDADYDEILDAMDEAESAKIIDADPNVFGRYRFSNALTRETLYEDFSATRRIRLHKAVGEALEEEHSDDLEGVYAELAYHFSRAAAIGTAVKAVSYLRGAARVSVAAFSYEEAAEYLQAALRIIEETAGETFDSETFVETMLEAADALDRSGEPDRANDLYRRAIDEARAHDLPDHLGRAVLGLGGFMGEIGTREDDLVVLLEEALGALGNVETETVSRLHSRLSMAVNYQYDESAGRGESVRLVDRAVEIAEKIGDEEALAYALFAREFALASAEHAQTRLETAERMIDIAERTGVPDIAMRGRIFRIVSLFEMGNIEEVDKEIERAAEVSAAQKQPLGLWYVAMLRAMRALLSGSLDQAEQLAMEALNYGQRSVVHENPMMYYMAQLAVIRREQGRFDELIPLLKGYTQQFPDLSAFRAALAYGYSEIGEIDEARAHFDAIAHAGFETIPRDFHWLISMTLLTMACAHLEDAERARDLYELLLPFGGYNIVIGQPSSTAGAASTYLGQLAATMGEYDKAAKHFEDGIAMNEKMGARSFLAHTKREYAACLSKRKGEGDDAKAKKLVEEALAEYTELGMDYYFERAEKVRAELA